MTLVFSGFLLLHYKVSGVKDFVLWVKEAGKYLFSFFFFFGLHVTVNKSIQCSHIDIGIQYFLFMFEVGD